MKKIASSKFPKVSIIFAAHNEEKIIGQKLENHCSLDYPKDSLEILIGTDACSDRTEEIIKKFQEKSPIVKLLEGKERAGKCNTLNKLLPLAQGEIIIFTDANTIFEKHAVKELIKHFSNLKVGIVCGELRLRSPDENIGGVGESAYWKYETFIKKAAGKFGKLLGATGGIYAIRKDIVENFPTSRLIMDDFWQAVRARIKNYLVVYEGQARAFEMAGTSLKEEWSRKVRIGTANINVVPMLMGALNPIKPFLMFQYLSHKLLRWGVPFLLLGIYLINIFQLGCLEGRVLFVTQNLFYLFSVLGFKIKIFKMFTYFISMNAALFVGFFKALFGHKELSWKPTQR